jgi:hypothetical protein
LRLVVERHITEREFRHALGSVRAKHHVFAALGKVEALFASVRGVANLTFVD